MGRFDRLINAGALGGVLLFSGAAFAQSNYPYFYPVEKMKGVYYTAGTPVLQAVGPDSAGRAGLIQHSRAAARGI